MHTKCVITGSIELIVPVPLGCRVQYHTRHLQSLDRVMVSLMSKRAAFFAVHHLTRLTPQRCQSMLAVFTLHQRVLEQLPCMVPSRSFAMEVRNTRVTESELAFQTDHSA
eukprot:TRINITY_DN6193_c0_g1::TRINITY_DN6193_c0_g1_i1::g.22647::m.22647 TRINITY_DN6193_c0_g1::TRINITY_DN6193_c0_g1_i1::g.22647  ORF type:complete len:110 (-),score=5.41 TRINITY_DN6193_c0_g1_i1:112-441(-)